jgi:hypothetical protein
MLPKEHGAYGQIAFPLVTALIVVGWSAGPLLTAASVVALFLAHEPLVVLLGERGPRARNLLAVRAWLSLHVALAAATAAGILAIDSTPPQLRWAFLVPIVPAVAMFNSTLRGREKGAVGETWAALASAAAGFAVCAAAGRPMTGAAIALAFAMLFVVSTLAVRVVILRTRAGGDVRAARATRMAAFAAVAAGAAIALAAASIGGLPWVEVVASAPGVAFAGWLAMRPPAPKKLKKVGWTLVGMSALTSVLLIAGA